MLTITLFGDRFALEVTHRTLFVRLPGLGQVDLWWDRGQRGPGSRFTIWREQEDANWEFRLGGLNGMTEGWGKIRQCAYAMP